MRRRSAADSAVRRRMSRVWLKLTRMSRLARGPARGLIESADPPDESQALLRDRARETVDVGHSRVVRARDRLLRSAHRLSARKLGEGEELVDRDVCGTDVAAAKAAPDGVAEPRALRDHDSL